MKSTIALVSTLALIAAGGLAAVAKPINTGDTTGMYFSQFCPRLQEVLTKNAFDYTCEATQGSRENVARVTADPTQIGYAQLDVYALESQKTGAASGLATIRTDIARECVFLVARNKSLTNYGVVASLAGQLRFILPPQQSGSTATFEFLRSIDPEGLGLATGITYAETTDKALEQALSADDTVTLFVQAPDPNSERFRLINSLEGHFIPVIDRNILRQQIGEEKIYYAQETEVKNATWIASGESLVTACTPTVLFTGSPDKLGDEKARQDQKDLIATLRGLAVEELQPKVGFLVKLWKQSKELSAKGVEQMVVMSEQAREAAGPMIDKAKEMGTKALEQAGEITEQAKKKAEELLKGSGGESTSP